MVRRGIAASVNIEFAGELNLSQCYYKFSGREEVVTSEQEWTGLMHPMSMRPTTGYSINSLQFMTVDKADTNCYVHVKLVTTAGDVFYYVSDFTVADPATDPV